MRTDWRPCEDGPDGDPCEKEGCFVCHKFHTDLRYSYLWRGPKPEPVTAPPRWKIQWWSTKQKILAYWWPVHRRVRRAWRFAIAVIRHTLAGFPRSTEAEVAARRKVCKPCIFRDQEKDECTQCGCRLGGEKKLIAKLAWARERCPMDYWGPVRGENVFRRGLRWLKRQLT